MYVTWDVWRECLPLVWLGAWCRSRTGIRKQAPRLVVVGIRVKVVVCVEVAGNRRLKRSLVSVSFSCLHVLERGGTRLSGAGNSAKAGWRREIEEGTFSDADRAMH